MLLDVMATKGRMGEWLDQHPSVALAIVALCVIACGLVEGM